MRRPPAAAMRGGSRRAMASRGGSRRVVSGRGGSRRVVSSRGGSRRVVTSRGGSRRVVTSRSGSRRVATTRGGTRSVRSGYPYRRANAARHARPGPSRFTKGSVARQRYGYDRGRHGGYNRPHGGHRYYRKGRWYDGSPRWRGDRRWHGGYYWRPSYNGWYYWANSAWIWAPAFGIVAATIPYYVAPTTTVVVTSYEPWTDGWFAWCTNRYRSFDASTGTFMGYDGVRRFCVYRG